MQIESVDDELMVIAAHGYCLGRSTHIVPTCIFWLYSHWDLLSENTRTAIIRDTKRALERGAAGEGVDREAWQQFVHECGDH